MWDELQGDLILKHKGVDSAGFSSLRPNISVDVEGSRETLEHVKKENMTQTIQNQTRIPPNRNKTKLE